MKKIIMDIRSQFGSCERFCPDAEVKMRIRMNLLNFFELKDGQMHVPGVLVTQFKRSAANSKMPKAKDMRTEQCLTKTVEYLLEDILMDKRKPYYWTYDFIFDRLRMVRRETIIQQYAEGQTIRLLKSMIMFLAYSRYRLCTQPIYNFDDKICNQHLQECVNIVLRCYKELDEETAQLNESTGNEEHMNEEAKPDLQQRCFIEALYQVLNLGTTQALQHGLTLPTQVRENNLFKLAFSICMNYHQGNLYRVIMGLTKLPHIICAVAANKVHAIRRRLLQMFAHAYNNKKLTVPTSYLLRLTLMDSQMLSEICRHYNLRLTVDRKSVHFSKIDFKSDAKILNAQHEAFVEAKLSCIHLPEVLLLKKL